MTATFTYVPKKTDSDDAALKKVPVTAKVDPRLEEVLDAFGKRLRALGVHHYGTGGKSNAVEAVLEMAYYLDWFDDVETFAAKIMQFRADALAGRPRKK